MPGIYTHWRFGNKVLKGLPIAFKEKVTPFPRLFNLGLQGPDLLFYHKPLKKNPLKTAASLIHARPGRLFFEPALETARSRTGEDRKRAFAYLIGCLCHFALDSECHPYVEEAIRTTGVEHMEIESELERTQMKLDGLDPLIQPTAAYVASRPEDAVIISQFFPEFTPKEIAEALRTMQLARHLLSLPGKTKRTALLQGMKLIGIHQKYGGLMIAPNENPLCRETSKRLNQISDDAVPLAIQLITDYTGPLKQAIATDTRFNRSFNG